ncbi:hypothetical protein Lal_00017615, partial [Lupinus albus]
VHTNGIKLQKFQQSPNYVGDDCHNSTEQVLTNAYQTNLNNTLSWLSYDASTSKGYNHTTIGNDTNDAVYALYDCRGDVTGSFCQFCVSTAASQILQICPKRSSAIIWYNFCILRYSNHDFFGNITITPSWQILGHKNITNQEEAKKAKNFMQSLIRKATVETNMLYAMGSFNLSANNEERYGLVQCSRDINSEQCGECLEAMLDKVPQCCETKLGWQVLAPSCLMKYDDNMFYLINDKTTSPSSLPNPVKEEASSKSKTYIIIIICVLVAVALLSFSIYYLWLRKQSNKDGMISETTPISFHDHAQRGDSINADLPTIPLIWIKHSTNNFSEECKLGEGGFGPVYKGSLQDGTEVAVKRLLTKSGQGLQEFKNEAIFIAKLQHRNLVRLLGCCIEENEKLLVYEYMPNSSLDLHLFSMFFSLLTTLNLGPLLLLLPEGHRFKSYKHFFACDDKACALGHLLLKAAPPLIGEGCVHLPFPDLTRPPFFYFLYSSSLLCKQLCRNYHFKILFLCCFLEEEKRKQLDWKLRVSIINGIAKGLLYLHEDSRLRVIHRDMKASNVLLDREMNPKISDFGLARAFEKDQSEENTRRVMGTYGYMAPEYAMEGLYSVKSDVFSFGVLLLEIICGQRNSGFYLSDHGQSLLLYVSFSALLSEEAIDRPTMSTVVVMLASDTMVLPNPNHPAFSVGRKIKEEESTSKSSKDASVNEVTISNVVPR